jgi:hypothetical protein
VNEAFAQARRYGIRVRFADLGDWGRDELRAEYDPAIPEIRLNRRVVEALSAPEIEEFVARAVGHELYHHREHVGEIAVLRDREARERAADEFARSLDYAAARLRLG